MPNIRENSGKYYEYILIYTDHLLVISIKPREILNKLNKNYTLKDDSAGKPKIYPGSGIYKYHINGDDKPKGAMGIDRYFKDFIRNTKILITSRNLDLESRAPSVIPSGYKTKMYMDQTTVVPTIDNIYHR